MVRTADLVEYSSDAAFAVDAGMRVVGWNTGAETLLGYAPEETIGKYCGDILLGVFPSGEPLCTTMCAGQACFLRGDKWAVETCRFRHKNGDMVSASISTLVVPAGKLANNDGDAVAVVFLRESGPKPVEQAASHVLRIYTLGHFCLTIGGNGLIVDQWKRRQAATILKCLVTNLGLPVHRERLIEWLWPDTDGGRGWERLKVTVSYLRGQLRAEGVPEDAIQTVDKSYLLRRDAVWVDAHAFEQRVTEGRKLANQGRPAEALACFDDARRLYRGDYLETDLYTDWCAEERERLHEINLEMLAGLAQSHSELGEFLEASQACRTALFRDPCRESFLQSLLESLVRLGRPDWAEAQFKSWRRRLGEDFGLEPTAETWRVYRELVCAEGDA
ncbi:MAG: PAS domain S-box protein [Alphaproteobacteria bacterium]|nr:PAS domain S-box protein [Alphaproteobacteria bacterium]